MPDVHGFCDERFEALAEAFRGHLESGFDKGASLAATLHGEPVVDLWGGTRDWNESVPWERDTIVRVFSTSKEMVILSVLLLVDRGLLDLDAPIASYWPEFARHGKGQVTTRQVLVYRSGVPGFGRKLSFPEFADPDCVRAALEDAPLWFEPGANSCYSPHAFGPILGEVVHRISGVPLDEFFRRELSGPMNVDFHFSIDEEDAARVAALWPPVRPPEFPTELGKQVFTEVFVTTEMADPAHYSKVFLSGSGLTNARALARVGAMVAMGGQLDGVRYLSRETIDEAGREQSYVEDALLGWMRMGLGFGLDSKEFPAATPTSMHWGGYGGSFLTMDPAAGISCAFAPNQLVNGDEFGDDPRLSGYWRIVGEITRELS